jgi:hypothetical protein
MDNIIKEIENLYKIIRLKPFRKTEGVSFDIIPKSLIPRVDAVDRVIHKNGAISPGPVGDVKRPWYMHPYQDDNLMVLYGMRIVDIYTKKHGKIENFIVTPDKIIHNGELVFEGGAMLVWPKGVFHRIISGEDGSASINLATHYDGFNIKNNFNIYELCTETGTFQIIRDGFLDQNN